MLSFEMLAEKTLCDTSIVAGFNCIYKFTKRATGKVYIGQTVDFEARMNQYQSDVRNGVDRHIINGIRKNGWDAYDIEILEHGLSGQDEMDDREIYWIAHFNCWRGYGYNEKDGGESGRHSEITKQKIRDANLGKTQTDETKMKISKGMLGKNLGKTQTDETKMKISENHARPMLGKRSGRAKPMILVKDYDSRSETYRKVIAAFGGVGNTHWTDEIIKHSGLKNPEARSVLATLKTRGIVRNKE